MQILKLKLPESFDWNENQTQRFLAAKLYESGKLSLGQAANMAGLSKVTFSEILADFGVSLINYDPEDIRKDVAQF